MGLLGGAPRLTASAPASCPRPPQPVGGFRRLGVQQIALPIRCPSPLTSAGSGLPDELAQFGVPETDKSKGDEGDHAATDAGQADRPKLVKLVDQGEGEESYGKLQGRAWDVRQNDCSDPRADGESIGEQERRR